MDKLPTRNKLLHHFYEHWRPQLGTETIPIDEAEGRICAKSYQSGNQIPLVRSSAFDGIAVKSASFSDGMPDTSVWIKDQDFCRADTGDDFPDEFDTVIRIEAVTFLPESGVKLDLSKEPVPGEGVRTSGSFMSKNDELVKEGDILTPLSLTSLLAGGYTTVEVKARPRVVFLPTGSELIKPGTPLTRGKNIETNGSLIKMIMSKWGADVTCLPICYDNHDSLRNAIFTALDSADILIVNGGSSKGNEDFTVHLLEKESSFFAHGVRCVPGRPAVFSLIQDKPVINLPGPPAAALAVLSWGIKDLYYHAMGSDAPHSYQEVILTETVSGAGPFDLYQRLFLYKKDGQIYGKPFSMKDSNAEVNQYCNGYTILHSDQSYLAGSPILADRLFSSVR